MKKDLLDQQIIDTNGRKVVRVNDVDLLEQRTNGNTELRIEQVDVGLPGAVRRLLQGIVPPAAIRRMQEKLPQRVIRWEVVNLIEPDPLRRVKLRLSSDRLAELHPADIAEIMEELSPDERQSLVRHSPTRLPPRLSPNSTSACKRRSWKSSIPKRPPTSSRK